LTHATVGRVSRDARPAVALREDPVMHGPTYLALLLALMAAGSVSWQQRTEPPVLKIGTDLVSLTVTVVDRQGVLVPGLRQEHFTIYDNGERQTIQFFASEDVAATIGLLIDSSGSMRGRRDQVTTAAAAFAAMCDPLDEFFTVNFNEWVWRGLPPDVPFTADIDQLRAALSAAPADGMTALYDAVSRALTHLQRGTRDRKALVVVSDGGDNASVQTLDDVVQSARQSDAAIYSVTLFDPDNRDGRRQVLKTLAGETGGRAFVATDAADVTRSFAQIAREIRSGYTIGFVPNDTSRDGFRSIRVVVDAANHRQLIARTRAGYYAGPAQRPAR
jgi:Ca-activated chloride channel family protein